MSRRGLLDADAHVLEPREMWARYIDPPRKEQAPRIVRTDERTELLTVAGKALSPYSVSPLGAVGLQDVTDYDGNRAGGFDPRARLADMDAEGIERVVLYPTLGLFMGGVEDAALAAAIARAYNDWLTDYCSAAPERLFAAAMVPLQDVELAAQEIGRVGARDCFRAVFVRPNPYAGRPLHTRRYDPVWSACAEHDLVVGVHEGAVGNMPTAGVDRFDNLYFRHIVAHTFEMQVAVLSLIGGGVLERYPQLRFAFLEAGGGWIAAWLDRMDDHHRGIFGRFVPWLRLPPSEYFQRQCWISFEPDERTLPSVAGLIGVDRIVWGSDYPHVDACFPGFVAALDRALVDLDPSAREQIRSRNAASLYRLS